MSGIAEVLGRLLPSVRVILREVEGVPVPLAGDKESTWSRSIGVEAIVGQGRKCVDFWRRLVVVA
jgi:hypothetical protein